MTSKTKLVIIGLALVVILAGGSLSYQALSKAYAVEQEKTAQSGSEQAAENQPEENQPPKGTEGEEGEQLPEGQAQDRKEPKYVDFSAETLDGRTVSLSDYEGQSAFVLNFWASWCGPCKVEMPHFDKLEEEYREKGVTFLMVNLTDGQRETGEKAKAYLDGAGLSFDNVLLDTEGIAAYIYNVSSIPTTYVFDRDGYYVKGFVGTITEKQLRTEIEKIGVSAE